MVSVIIPIYNVRKFIGRGLQQILGQTYKDLEIIMVDDGSTDGSYEECLRWSRQDKRIRVLHQQNNGAGSARNLGIENSKGEFIYFFDIDDEMVSNLLGYNVHMMIQKDVDMIVFGYRNVETTFRSDVRISFPETDITSNQQLRDVFVGEFIMKTNGFPWNKFYRKSFLDKHNLRFEDQRIQQDEVFNLMCYEYVERMYISPAVLYTYYIYEKGNTRSRFIADRFDIYKSVRQHFEQIKSFWNLNDLRFDDYLNKRFYTSVLQCMLFNLTHPNCPWTKAQKRYEMERIMNDPLTIEAFEYADTHIVGIEQKLYRKSCRSMNLRQIVAYRKFFDILHNIRKKLR